MTLISLYWRRKSNSRGTTPLPAYGGRLSDTCKKCAISCFCNGKHPSQSTNAATTTYSVRILQGEFTALPTPVRTNHRLSQAFCTATIPLHSIGLFDCHFLLV